MSRCRFVEDHRADYPVADLCRLAEVSRSSYYRFRDPIPRARQMCDHELLDPIIEIHERSRRTYGAPRITGQLRRRGLIVNHKRVARIMAEHGIAGFQRRRRGKRVDHGTAAFAPDLLQRDFTAEHPNQRWVADITEFNTLQGRLYLAAIKDLYSNAIVGWATAPRRTAELVVDALVNAISRRQPAGEVTHHADHGSQYVSMAFTDAAADARVVLSFGAIGDCYDNAAAESMFSTIKGELEHIHAISIWPDHASLRSALFDYIEIFYNRPDIRPDPDATPPQESTSPPPSHELPCRHRTPCPASGVKPRIKSPPLRQRSTTAMRST
ncbi:MAG: IS3 family transposase [Actinomycetota bacterium]